MKVFPSLATRPLHLTGESYAGTYIVRHVLFDISRSLNFICVAALYHEDIFWNGKTAREHRKDSHWGWFRCFEPGFRIAAFGIFIFILLSTYGPSLYLLALHHRDLPPDYRLRPGSIQLLQRTVRFCRHIYRPNHRRLSVTGPTFAATTSI